MSFRPSNHYHHHPSHPLPICHPHITLRSKPLYHRSILSRHACTLTSSRHAPHPLHTSHTWSATPPTSTHRSTIEYNPQFRRWQCSTRSERTDENRIEKEASNGSTIRLRPRRPRSDVGRPPTYTSRGQEEHHHCYKISQDNIEGLTSSNPRCRDCSYSPLQHSGIYLTLLRYIRTIRHIDFTSYALYLEPLLLWNTTT